MNESRIQNRAAVSQTVIRDDRLIGLGVMLNDDLSRDQISSALSDQSIRLLFSEIRYVRYKPATNCIIGYRLKYVLAGRTEEDSCYAYAKCYLKEDFANAKEKLEGMSDVGPMCPVSLPEINTIIYPVWCDKELEGVELAFSPRKMARPLRDGLTEFPDTQWRLSDKKLRAEIVRYKPERRAVIKLDTRAKNRTTGEKIPLTVYARCYADDRGGTIGPLMTALSETGALLDQPVIVPSPISYILEKRVLLTRSIEGRPLSDCMSSGEAELFLTKSGAALSWIHSVKYEQLKPLSNSDYLHEVCATADSLSQIVPSQAALIKELKSALVKKLSPEIESSIGLIHGDFYSDQVLVSSVDRPVAVIDFDRVAYGDQLIDLANFCADLRLEKMWRGQDKAKQFETAFLRGYYKSQVDSARPGHFETLVAAQMLRQVIAPFRRWDSGWQEKIRIGLEICRKVIG